MASLQFYSTTLTITGVASNVATVASTTGLAPNLKAWLTKSDNSGSTRVYIDRVLSSTTLRLMVDPESGGSPYGKTPVDLTLYNSGKLYFEDQLIYNNA